MIFFGFSLLILSICIILGQSKPAQHMPHALPKKCIDAHDCKTGYTCMFKLCARFKHNLGPQEGGAVQEGSFQSAKKSREQSKLPPSARLSALSSAPPVAEELSTGSGPPPFNEGIDYKDPPSPKTEDDYLKDAEYEPDDTDDVPGEEGDPKGEEPEIQENGNHFFYNLQGCQIC